VKSKIALGIILLLDIVVGTFIFINLMVAVAANTLVSLVSKRCCTRYAGRYCNYLS